MNEKNVPTQNPSAAMKCVFEPSQFLDSLGSKY